MDNNPTHGHSGTNSSSDSHFYEEASSASSAGDSRSQSRCCTDGNVGGYPNDLRDIHRWSHTRKSRRQASKGEHSTTMDGHGCTSSDEVVNEDPLCLQQIMKSGFYNLRCIWKGLEEDSLPWQSDFLHPQKMSLPLKGKEMIGRLNLNIPYYASNYWQIFYVMTAVFLVVSHARLFLVFFSFCALGYYIAESSGNLIIYRGDARVFGRRISYRQFCRAVLASIIICILVKGGLKVVFSVILLNVAVIVAHALLRKPTYFDDEELEKCRPKLIQYALELLFLVLAYLEGASPDDPEDANFKLAQQERIRLGLLIPCNNVPGKA